MNHTAEIGNISFCWFILLIWIYRIIFIVQAYRVVHSFYEFLIKRARMNIHLHFLIETLTCPLNESCFLTSCFIHKVNGCLVMSKEECGSSWNMKEKYLCYTFFLIDIHNLEVAIKVKSAEIPFLYFWILLTQFWYLTHHSCMRTGNKETCFMSWLL